MMRIILGIFKKDEFKAELVYKTIIRTLLLFTIVTVNIVFMLNFKFGFVLTNSMDPTIRINDAHIIDVRVDEIKRGDIVYFFKDAELGNPRTIKRAMGLPGDTVEIIKNVLYINGEAIEEDYISQTHIIYNFDKTVVPEGEYFLLGDNRVASYDSRDYGTIKRDDIKGVIVHMLRFSNLFPN